jgi:hypothetical protein
VHHETGEDDEDRHPPPELGEDPDDGISRRVRQVPSAHELRHPPVEPLEPAAAEEVGGHECADDHGDDEQPPGRSAG